MADNINVLIESLADEDELVRIQIAESLEGIGEPAVDALIEALTHDDKNIRRCSAKVLGEIRDERAIEPLIVNLKDSNKWVRRETSGALSKMGEPATDPLIHLLDDPDWKVRGAAAWALGRIGSKNAVEPLKKATEDESSYVRNFSKKFLEKWGESD